MVQIGLDLPKINHAQVERILVGGLDTLLKELPDTSFDQPRWGNVYVGGLRAYFQTIRDVRRYLASLSFHVPLLTRRSAFEVNAIDLFAVEAIRVFEPRVYQRMRGAKGILTDNRPSDRSLADHRAKQIADLVGDTSEERRPQLQELFIRLFPQIEWAFGGAERDPGFNEEWSRQLRICSPELYDKYLHFAVLEDEVSQVDLQDIISLIGDRRRLVETLRQLGHRGLLASAVERLDAYKKELPIESAVPFVTALFDIGDELLDDPVGTEIGAGTYLRSILYSYLRQELTEERRFEILNQAIRETTGLIQPIVVVKREKDEKTRSESPATRLVTAENAATLANLCVDKIRNSASDGQLYTSPRLSLALRQWREWGSPEEATTWVQNLCASPAGALTILRAFVVRGHATYVGDHVARTTHRVSVKELQQFVELSTIERQIANLKQADLDDTDRGAIRAFQIAMRRHKEGKPESDFLDEADDP